MIEKQENMEVLQVSAVDYHNSVETSRILAASSSQSTSIYLSNIDGVLFCAVILISFSMGVLHSYLISRGNEESSSHEISPEMDNQYETIHIRSQRGSDASSVGNTPSTRNSIMDIDGMGRDRKPSEDTNGTANKRNNLENSTSSTKKLGHGFAIMQRSTYLAANVDIMFQIVCFASIILILGLPLYSYFHGWSLVISILPAMMSAHITAIVIVIPFVNIYQKKKEEQYSRKSCMNHQHELSFFNYFLKRFGGSDYSDTSYKDANHIDVPNPTSTTNISFRILLVLTWLLVFVLWAFIAVCKYLRSYQPIYTFKYIFVSVEKFLSNFILYDCFRA